MASVLRTLKARLATRPDSEHHQVLVRIAIIALIIGYLVWSDVLVTGTGQTLPLTWLILIAALAISLALFAAILRRPGISHPRRWIGMLTDYSALGIIACIEGESTAPLYAVYLWVAIGNGMRYGHRYLRAATALAATSFLAVVLISPYWRANPYLAWGLLIGLVAVPLYFDSLLRALMRAMDAARAANEAKSRFLANMSHEFRTPLHGLAGVSELLATTRLDGEQRECLETIQASTRSLLALVEDVLDISAIEAGKVKLDPVAFVPRELIDSVGLILQPQASAKQLRFETSIADDLPSLLRGDIVHLRQVLLNLVGNAVKFTSEGSVKLDVAVSEQDAEHVRLRFTISDTGIGVPAAMHRRLFEAFEQADGGLARAHGGTGLGTTIAKGLTEAMGGSIGFESVENRGSRFWVELPFERPAAISAEQSAAPSPSTAVDVDSAAAPAGNVIAFSDPFLRHRVQVPSLSILIADDHAANRMVLRRLLEKAGHHTTCVASGEAVLDALAMTDYDAVVADLHMPDVSGLDLLRQLRVMEAGSRRRTPVVMLSADVTPESIRACEQNGARAFLGKPVPTARLLDSLADIARGERVDGTMIAERGEPVLVGDGVFDSSMLDEIQGLGIGEGFEHQFIVQCLLDAETCLTAFAQAGEDKDWGRMREQAHALKGVASNLGLIKLAAVGGEAMSLPDWQLTQDWRLRADALRDCLDAGRLALDARQHQRESRDKGEQTT